MAITNKQATIRGLLALGYIQTFNRITRKYEVFTSPTCDHQMLIGRSGGIRKVGYSQPLNKSVSLTDTISHKILINIGSESPFILEEGEDLRRWAVAEWRYQAARYLSDNPHLSVPAAPIPS